MDAWQKQLPSAKGPAATKLIAYKRGYRKPRARDLTPMAPAAATDSIRGASAAPCAETAGHKAIYFSRFDVTDQTFYETEHALSLIHI